MRTEKDIIKETAHLKHERKLHKNKLAQEINGQSKMFEDKPIFTQQTLFEIKIDSSIANIYSILTQYDNNIYRLLIELNIIRKRKPVNQLKIF